MKLGWVRYSPRFPVEAQRKALANAGVEPRRIYEAGKGGVETLDALIKSIRSGDTVVVDGLHRLAPSWAALARILDALDEKRAHIALARTGKIIDPGSAAAIAEAKRVYDGEARIPTYEEAVARGRKGGRKAVPLGKVHQRMWKDAAKYATNLEAAQAVSKDIGKPVRVATLRRKFGPSGRLAGWPSMRKDTE